MAGIAEHPVPENLAHPFVWDGVERSPEPAGDFDIEFRPTTERALDLPSLEVKEQNRGAHH